MDIEIFAQWEDVLGEGPTWSECEQALYWIDIGKKKLHRKTLTGKYTHWSLPDRPGCVERLGSDQLAVTLKGGVYRFDPGAGTTTLLHPVTLAPGVRFNEGKADPMGRLWFGSMQDNFGPDGAALAIERPEGSLFRLDADGQLAVLEQGITIANTLAWSVDKTQLYFADSSLDVIFAYDYDHQSGDICNKRPLFEGANQGLPDGSAIDVSGCLWNARWGAGMILRIAPDGRVDRHIQLPVLQPTSCAFGGPHLETLFVTSARNGLSAEALARWPASGSVFAITGLAQGMAVPAMRWHPQ